MSHDISKLITDPRYNQKSSGMNFPSHTDSRGTAQYEAMQRQSEHHAHGGAVGWNEMPSPLQHQHMFEMQERAAPNSYARGDRVYLSPYERKLKALAQQEREGHPGGGGVGGYETQPSKVHEVYFEQKRKKKEEALLKQKQKEELLKQENRLRLQKEINNPKGQAETKGLRNVEKQADENCFMHPPLNIADHAMRNDYYDLDRQKEFKNFMNKPENRGKNKGLVYNNFIAKNSLESGNYHKARAHDTEYGGKVEDFLERDAIPSKTYKNEEGNTVSSIGRMHHALKNNRAVVVGGEFNAAPYLQDSGNHTANVSRINMYTKGDKRRIEGRRGSMDLLDSNKDVWGDKNRVLFDKEGRLFLDEKGKRKFDNYSKKLIEEVYDPNPNQNKEDFINERLKNFNQSEKQLPLYEVGKIGNRMITVPLKEIKAQQKHRMKEKLSGAENYLVDSEKNNSGRISEERKNRTNQYSSKEYNNSPHMSNNSMLQGSIGGGMNEEYYDDQE